MQHGLRIAVVAAVAVGSIVAGAGSALAAGMGDDGPVNINNDGSKSKHATHGAKPKLQLPTLNGTKLG